MSLGSHSVVLLLCTVVQGKTTVSKASGTNPALWIYSTALLYEKRQADGPVFFSVAFY